MKFLNVIFILFLHCCHLPCEMKSHHGLMSWNLVPGLKSRYKQPLRWSFLQKWLIIFAKGSILDVWLGPECTSVVCVIILFVKFLIQPYLLLFLDFSSDSKLFQFCFFLSFSIFHETHTPALQLATKSYYKGLVTSSDLSLHNWGTLL